MNISDPNIVGPNHLAVLLAREELVRRDANVELASINYTGASDAEDVQMALVDSIKSSTKHHLREYGSCLSGCWKHLIRVHCKKMYPNYDYFYYFALLYFLLFYI